MTPVPSLPESVRERAVGFVGRRWVLDEVRRWLEDRSERYFMILGEPGSGKTAVAAWLAGAMASAGSPAAADAPSPGDWDAVHFCIARGQRGTVNPSQFAQSLSEQLAHRYDAFAVAVLNQLSPNVTVRMEAGQNLGTMIGLRLERLYVSDRDAEDLYDRIVRQPLRALAQADPDVKVNILVDALDESFAAAGPNIASLIAGSDDLPANVRFLITTRAEPRVVDQFDNVRELDLSAAAHEVAAQADLQGYLGARFRSSSSLRALLAADAAALRDRIAERADGNFLYAKFVLDELASGRRTPGGEIELPQGLHELYRSFLDRLVPPDRFSDVWPRRYAPFFGCLTVATPIAPDEMLPSWLGWTTAELNVHIDDTAQFIEHVTDAPKDIDGYRLYHSSIADFLIKKNYEHNGKKRTNKYYIERKREHARIASFYLAKIETEWAGDWGKSDSYGLMNLPTHLLESGDDGRLLELMKAPFLSANIERFVTYRMVLDDIMLGIQAAERQSNSPALLRLAVSYVAIKQCIESLPRQAIERLLSMYAASGHAERAVDLAQLIDDPTLRAVVMRAIVEGIAEVDRELAMRIADQIDDDPFSRAEALEKVLDAVVRDGQSPEDVHEKAIHLLAVVNQISPSTEWAWYWHAGLVRRIAVRLRATDPVGAMTALTQAIDEARMIDRDQWRYETLAELAESCSANPGLALALYDESLAAAEEVSNKGWAGSQIGTTIGAIAVLDLDRAVRVAAAVSNPVGKCCAFTEIAHQVAQSDTDLASSLIEQALAAANEVSYLGKAESRTWHAQSMARIGWAVAALDFDEAIEFVESRDLLSERDSFYAQVAADPIHPVDRAI
jgi:hypothetical protein